MASFAKRALTAGFYGALLLGCATLAPGARGQGAEPGPIQLKPGAQPEQPPADQQKIRVRVSEVTAPVTVRNRSGEMVFDLTEKNFRVLDNGVPQKIEHFDLGGDALSVVLVAETSSRVEALLPTMRQTAIVFTQTVMAKSGDAAVIGFDDSVNLLAKFTSDGEQIEKVIGHLQEGTSGVLLSDAMMQGVTLLDEQPAARRRILLVMAEARDTGSESKLGEVLRKAELANVTIYSIGLSTTAAALKSKPDNSPPVEMGPPGTFPVPTPNGMPQTPDVERQMQQTMDLGALAVWLVKTGMNALGPNALAVASKATGGLNVKTMKDQSIEKAMDEIGGELHAQYTLAYRPSDGGGLGYHEIKVEVDRPGVSVRTRPGYYVGPPE